MDTSGLGRREALGSEDKDLRISNDLRERKEFARASQDLTSSISLVQSLRRIPLNIAKQGKMAGLRIVVGAL